MACGGNLRPLHTLVAVRFYQLGTISTIRRQRLSLPTVPLYGRLATAILLPEWASLITLHHRVTSWFAGDGDCSTTLDWAQHPILPSHFPIMLASCSRRRFQSATPIR